MPQHQTSYAVWLRTNTRADGVLLVIALCVVGMGGIISTFGGTMKTIAFAMMGIGIGGAILQIRELINPRLATDGKYLLVFSGGWKPVRIPLTIVEVFFLGQGPSKLPQPTGKPLENSTVVVRLAEAATEWHRRRTNKRVAHWCEGYITLRGVWCEPLTTDTLRRLNSSLVEIKRNLKDAGDPS